MTRWISLTNASRILGVNYRTARRWLEGHIEPAIVDGRRQSAIRVEGLRDILREKSGDEIDVVRVDDALDRLEELSCEVSKQREQLAELTALLKKVSKKINGHNV